MKLTPIYALSAWDIMTSHSVSCSAQLTVFHSIRIMQKRKNSSWKSMND